MVFQEQLIRYKKAHEVGKKQRTLDKNLKVIDQGSNFIYFHKEKTTTKLLTSTITKIAKKREGYNFLETLAYKRGYKKN